MIDLITKENSFYALYNEPFGDILKAFLIRSPNPALLGLVADLPAPVDKEVSQIAKNVVQFAVQRIEISGVKNDPRETVSDILNEIDRQLKANQVNNGIICCSVIFVYEGSMYIGGVGDCTIALSNDKGILRFCHDGDDEPRPEGVENITIAPAELMGLRADTRVGDLPSPYSEQSVYVIEADPTLNIYMFSDGLTKHIPDFFTDLMGRTANDVFSKVNRKIPKDTDQLLDDICFSVLNLPPELATQKVEAQLRPNRFTQAEQNLPTESASEIEAAPKIADTQPVRAKKKRRSGNSGFWVLFIMLFLIMVMLVMFGLAAAYEWLSFKSEILELLKRSE